MTCSALLGVELVTTPLQSNPQRDCSRRGRRACRSCVVPADTALIQLCFRHRPPSSPIFRSNELLVVRLPLVIAHPRLQRHGALNRVAANDETKRVSARVVKHPRDRRQTAALGCAPPRLAAQWLADLGERGSFGRTPLEALSSARRAGEPAEAMVLRAPSTASDRRSASALATPGP